MKENSIEEDIIKAQHFINFIKTDKDYKDENGWNGYYNKEIVKLAGILEHILSDYKRVLKENELAKQALIKNCNIADERNQLLKENEELKADNYELNNIINDLLDNIPVQKVKDKIEEICQKMDKAIDNSKGGLDEKFINKGIKLLAQKQVLQELIEESEKK